LAMLPDAIEQTWWRVLVAKLSQLAQTDMEGAAMCGQQLLMIINFFLTWHVSNLKVRPAGYLMGACAADIGVSRP